MHAGSCGAHCGSPSSYCSACAHSSSVIYLETIETGEGYLIALFQGGTPGPCVCTFNDGSRTHLAVAWLETTSGSGGHR